MGTGWPAPYLAAAVGGAIGASGRYGLSLVWPLPQEPGSWPTATFVTNMTGCALLGLVLVIAMEVAPLAVDGPRMRLLRPFAVTGVLGGYTTFSTFSLEIHTLLRSGEGFMAGLYAVASIGGGVIAFGGALACGEWAYERLRRPSRHRGVRDGMIAVETAEAVTEEEA